MGRRNPVDKELLKKNAIKRKVKNAHTSVLHIRGSQTVGCEPLRVVSDVEEGRSMVAK